MKPAAKTGIKIVAVIYVAVIAAFVVTAVQRTEPKNKQELTAQLQKRLNEFRQQAYEADPQHIRERPLSEDEAAQALRIMEAEGSIIAPNYTMIMQWLNFGILLLVLYGFFWDPLVQFLDERRDEVRGRLKNAEEKEEQSEELLEQRREQLREVKRERADIIDQGKQEAQREKERIRQEARDDAERMREEARDRVNEEVRRARAGLRDEVASLASDVAEKILERELSRDDHDRILDEMLDSLSEEGQQESEEKGQ